MTREPGRLPRLQLAAACLGLAAIFGYRLSTPVVDPDLWHQMALFREMWAQGRVLLEDVFAYTPTVTPSVQHEWGAGAIAYALALWGGGPALVALRFALAFGLGALCWWAARLRGAPYALIVPLSLLAIALADAGFSTVRAQMYSFVGLAALLVCLALDAQGRRGWIPVWLGLYVLWLNLHAGFLLGAGLFALYTLEQWLAGRPHRHLWATGLAMAPLVLLTPYHLHYPAYLWRAVTLPRPHIGEWGPLWDATSPAPLVFLLGSLALVAYAVRVRGWRHSPALSLLAASAGYALLSRRMLPFYAVVWLCTTPALLAATPLGASFRSLWSRGRPLQLACWSAGAALFLASALPAQPWHLRVPGAPVPRSGSQAFYPVGAVDYLAEQGFSGNLLVGFDWGAYVLWKLSPRVKVSLDSRYEVAYPPQVEAEQYDFFLARPGWQTLLERDAYRDTDAILAPRFLPSRIHEKLAELPGWRRVYRDRRFEVFARSDSPLPLLDRPDVVREGRFP